MHPRKIVFRAPGVGKRTPSSEDPTVNSDQSAAHVSQSLKTTAAGKRPRINEFQSPESNNEVVFCLKPELDAASIPLVSEISALSATGKQEVGELRIKSIPERFRKREAMEDEMGEVYAFVSESRSAPSTPLHKTKSGEKMSKHEQEERMKHDRFDDALDALLIMGLELKALTKNFLPERDSAKLEQKLQEHVGLLKDLEDIMDGDPVDENERVRREQQVLTEMWRAIDDGVHPDMHLVEQSEDVLKQSRSNIKRARIVEQFLEIGENLAQGSEQTHV